MSLPIRMRILSGLFAAGCVLSASYAAILTGRIVEAESGPLPGAAVTLTPADSVRPLLVTVADDSGKYLFNVPDTGTFDISAFFLGMDTVRRRVEIKDSDINIEVPEIVLSESGIMLKEAVVTGTRTAVVARQDTLEFNAGSFHTAPNATVEQLLKRLPGVEVGTDGSITSGGKTVTKILVDGKEFFGDDPKMATKNLPSDMVEKVQVVDRKSETARLTGVDDGEDETVINLTVKKDRKNGWFGNLSAAYGTDRRYNGSFVVNRFQNGNQFTLLGGLNNVNDMGFTDGGMGRFSSFGGAGGILTSRRLGFNFNVGNEEKFRVGGNVMYSYSDRDTKSSRAMQYLFQDSTSYFTSGSRSRDKGHNVNADLRLRWNIDENNIIDFRPHFTWNSRRSLSADTSFLRAGAPGLPLVNSSENSRRNRGHSVSTNGNLIYTHKFSSRPGRSFSVRLRYSFSNTHQYGTSLTDLIYYLLHDDDETLSRFTDSRQWANSVDGRISWTEPLGNPERGNYLDLALSMNYKVNNSDYFTFDVPYDDFLAMPDYPVSPPAGSVESPDLSNRFRNTFYSEEVQIGYKKVNKKYNLNAGVTFSPSQSRSDNLIHPERNVPMRKVWNFAPYLRFRYKFSKQTSLMLRYRARTSEPSMSTLQPVADVSDPLHITIGNPDLKPTFTQSIFLNFHNFNMENKQSVAAFVNASYSLNSVVNRTVSDAETGVRTTTYSNVNGNFNIFAMAMLNRPIINSHWRISAMLHARYSNTPGYINGDFNRSGNLDLNPTLGLAYSVDVFQIDARPTYRFGMATNSLAMQKNQYTHTYGFTADVNADFPFGLSIGTDLDFSSQRGFSNGFNTSQWLWNAEISYSFLRDKSLNLFVKAYDILGQNKNISRSISSSVITDSSTNDLTRYFMVGLTWKFNTVGKRGGNRIPGLPDDMPEPPERGGRHIGPPPGGAPMGPPPGGGHRF